MYPTVYSLKYPQSTWYGPPHEALKLFFFVEIHFTNWYLKEEPSGKYLREAEICLIMKLDDNGGLITATNSIRMEENNIL